MKFWKVKADIFVKANDIEALANEVANTIREYAYENYQHKTGVKRGEIEIEECNPIEGSFRFVFKILPITFMQIWSKVRG